MALSLRKRPWLQSCINLAICGHQRLGIFKSHKQGVFYLTMIDLEALLRIPFVDVEDGMDISPSISLIPMIPPFRKSGTDLRKHRLEV